ncbi:dephospho-CoA kinase [Salinibacterium sp. SWN1162]|uniref:dephospho-CoA kinase n=1 Tax=Salinibacterium sp. SWN1162 TaxID=2792053 RepID=UPI0018CF4560|nr:dephospho-CoA kinase [Salinibacterium sp. SWN1162]MBH0009326.1 dephospho-CoA kinase [Salinibacterium sp. SWN1162]
MHLIALTGGIASGKSTVAACWHKHGAVIVDADLLARQVVEPGSPALDAIAQRFGQKVLQDDGSLDRKILGEQIFGDAAAREALNAITHPAIGALAQQRFDDAEAHDPNVLVVYDIPLLVESGQSLSRFAAVVTVEADDDRRVQRLMEHRGMRRDEAERRVASQATGEQRRAVADFVIDSGDELEDTVSRADEVWRQLSRTLQRSR